MLLLAENEPMCIQNVKFTANNTMVLKGIDFEYYRTKTSLLFDCLTEFCNVVKQWASKCLISSPNLLNVMLLSKNGCFVSRLKNMTNCQVLGISWLRPMSSNAKYTPWDHWFGFLNVHSPLSNPWLVLLLGVWAFYEPVVCMKILSW